MTLMTPEPPKPAPNPKRASDSDGESIPDAAAPTASGWEIIPLGRGAWRVCDAARAPNDAQRLVAYVEKSDAGTLDVLWLRSPCPTRSWYRDLDELLDDLDKAVSAAQVAKTGRSTRPSEIPHFPPPSGIGLD